MIAAVLVLMITLGLGVALTATVDGQLHAAKYERNRESSFGLADAALNVQALQLSRSWPKTAAAQITSCDPTTSAAAGCPLNTAVIDGYTTSDFNTSCSTAPTTPVWKTTVRDNIAGEKYWSTAVNGRSAYDANGDNVLWVRSTATVRCRVQSIVAEVSLNVLPPISFPANVITANWFKTSNQGKKVIVDTLGTYAQPPVAQPGPAAQPSKVVLRCSAGSPSPCANFPANKGQVQPPTVQTSAPVSSSSITSAQLDQLRQQAVSAGTYYASGTCPSGAQLSSVGGAPVYVEGPCNLVIGANTQVNSGTTPGALIIVNGTVDVSGTATFYGLIYAVNAQGSSGVVVSAHGNGSIQGKITVDGNGGIEAGSSKTNIIYDARAGQNLGGSAGASVAKNTWRQLPSNTP
jgi:hypothetical protein